MLQKTTDCYWSCRYIESGVVFMNHGMTFCCDQLPIEAVMPGENAADAVDEFLALRNRYIQKNQTSNAPCKGCPLLQKRNWSQEKKKYLIDFVNLSVHTYCQFSCIYCALPKELIAGKRNIKESYDIYPLLEELERRNMLSKDCQIECSPGEITIHPKRLEYYSFFSRHACQVTFLTNAGKYDEEIGNILQKKQGCKIITSLDAGTRATFLAIHGVDLFDTVVANLKKYYANNAQICLKYIIMQENCGDTDIDQFIRLCSEIKVAQVIVSTDMNKRQIVQGKHVVRAAIRLVEGAIKNGLSFTVMPYFSETDQKEFFEGLLSLSEMGNSVKKLKELLNTPRLIFYGAGRNCDALLVRWDTLQLKKPDVIWDIRANSKDANGLGYPTSIPDFKMLNAECKDSVIITIVNEQVNQEVIQQLRNQGFQRFMTQKELELALIAREASKWLK